MLVGDLEEQRNFLLVTGVCKMHFYRQHGVNVSRDDNASHDSWNVILLQCSRGYYLTKLRLCTEENLVYFYKPRCKENSTIVSRAIEE